jgi:hypothetical protein
LASNLVDGQGLGVEALVLAKLCYSYRIKTKSRS